MRPLTLAILFTTLLTTSMSTPDTIVLPFNDRGEVSMKQIAQAILDAQGSRLAAPERLAKLKVPMNSTFGGWTVFGWNTMLGDYGLRMNKQARALHIEVDQEKVHARRREIGQWLATTFGIEPQTPKLIPMAGGKNTGPTIVLVHGVDSGAARFTGTAEALAKQNYRVIAFEYPNDGAIAPNAQSLADALNQIPPQLQNDLTLVGVSMGALLIREVIENPAIKHPPVARFVACAPPFHGSELARYRAFHTTAHSVRSLVDGKWAGLGIFDGLGLGSNDLLPESDFLAQANRRDRNPAVEYAIIAGNRSVLTPAAIENMRAGVNRIGGAISNTRDYLNNGLDVVKSYTGGHGDGAVRLESTRLKGVDDHIVLPFNHLEILADDDQEERIPGLRELLERLPPAN